MQRDTNKWESSDNYDNFRQLFSTLKSMETASRTRNALGERMFETTWTTRDNFFKVRRPTGRREENGWKSGWLADGMAVFNDWTKLPRGFQRLENGFREWGQEFPPTVHL